MKMNELSILIEELINCGNAMVKAAEGLKEYYSSAEVVPDKEEGPEKTTEATKEEKVYTKEEVIVMLADKAKVEDRRYKSDVKALVAKFSTDGTLTTVPAESYAALIKELGVIGNA